jgi:hypothetical protein
LTSNPYQPPSPLPDDPTIELPATRPVGISILAVLHAVGGVLICALGVYLVTQFKEQDRSSIIAWATITLTPLFAVLGIGTGIGLWLGKKWAWWLATFYYFQFALGGVIVLSSILVAHAAFDRPLTERSAELTGKHLGRLLIFSLLSWYMTRRNVFAHFEFQRLTRLRALCILAGVILLLAALLSLVIAIAISMRARLD